MTRKIKKRFLALLLSCAIVTGVTSTSVRDAYATSAGIIIGGGAVVGAETAFAYLLGIMGITAASAAVYENRDALISWGSTQLSKFKTWAGEKKDTLGAWAGSTAEEINATISSWCEKLSAGTLDKSDAAWAAMKQWLAGETYVSSGGDEIYNNMPWYGKNTTFPVGTRDWKVSFPDGISKEFGLYTLGNASDGWRAVLVFQDLPITIERLRDGTREQTWKFTSKNKPGSSNSLTYNGAVYYFLQTGNTIMPSVLPNYLGTDISHDNFKETAVRAFADGVTGVVGGTGDYTYAGGISNVLGGAGTLDNVDVVGTGSKAGDTDVVISWPRDYAFDQVLGGVASGDKTWADAIGSLGVGVVDKTAEGDKVIGNDGVTDKAWTYADVTTPDITIPGTGEAEASKNLKDYTLAGLEKVFPFCLPFDLIDFIKVLEAPAQAPHFVLPLKYPTLSGMATYEIDIDLSRFDDVASLLRDMECLLFIVGLIMITRSRMIRG